MLDGFQVNPLMTSSAFIRMQYRAWKLSHLMCQAYLCDLDFIAAISASINFVVGSPLHSPIGWMPGYSSDEDPSGEAAMQDGIDTPVMDDEVYVPFSKRMFVSGNGIPISQDGYQSDDSMAEKSADGEDAVIAIASDDGYSSEGVPEVIDVEVEVSHDTPSIVPLATENNALVVVSASSDGPHKRGYYGRLAALQSRAERRESQESPSEGAGLAGPAQTDGMFALVVLDDPDKDSLEPPVSGNEMPHKVVEFLKSGQQLSIVDDIDEQRVINHMLRPEQVRGNLLVQSKLAGVNPWVFRERLLELAEATIRASHHYCQALMVGITQSIDAGFRKGQLHFSRYLADEASRTMRYTGVEVEAGGPLETQLCAVQSQHTRKTGHVNANDEQVVKVLQKEVGIAIHVEVVEDGDKPRQIGIHGEITTPFDLIDKCNGETLHAGHVRSFDIPGVLDKHVEQRFDLVGVASTLDSAGACLRQDNYARLEDRRDERKRARALLRCKQHRVQWVMTKVYSGTVRSDISGIIHKSLGQRGTDIFKLYRQNLGRGLWNKVQIHRGLARPPLDSTAARYRTTVFDMLLVPLDIVRNHQGQGKLPQLTEQKLQQRAILEMHTHGDIREDIIPYYCADDTPDSVIKSYFQIGVVWALCPHKTDMFPRNRWHGADEVLKGETLQLAYHNVGIEAAKATFKDKKGKKTNKTTQQRHDLPMIKDTEQDAGYHSECDEAGQSKPKATLHAEDADLPKKNDTSFDWAEFNREQHKDALAHAESDPLGQLWCATAVMMVLGEVSKHSTWQSGEEWDLWNDIQAKLHGKFSYRILEDFKAVKECEATEAFLYLLASSDFWNIVPEQYRTFRLRRFVFSMLVAAAAALLTYLVLPDTDSLHELFSLLEASDPVEAAESFQAKYPDCRVHELISQWVKAHPGKKLGSRESLFSMLCVAVRTHTATVRIENRHGEWQRDVDCGSMVGAAPSSRINAQAVLRRARHIETRHWSSQFRKHKGQKQAKEGYSVTALSKHKPQK